MGKKSEKKLTLKERKELRMKNVDLVAIKKNINKELLSTSALAKGGHQKAATAHNENYYTRYSRYITEEFNSKCIFLIVSFINTSTTLPVHLRTEKNLHKELISIVKQLMMNEFEITLFTLNIDDIGWEIPTLNFSLHLLFIGILTKFHSNVTSELFLRHFKSENKNFIDCYSKWKDLIKENFFSIVDINERYKLLNRPHNSFCKKNYIDYNSVVDKIIQLSQPYGEECQGGMIKVKEENVLDNIQMTNFVNSAKPQLSMAMHGNQRGQTLINNNISINTINNTNIPGSNVSIPNLTANPLTLGKSGWQSFTSMSSKKSEEEGGHVYDLINKSFFEQNMMMNQSTKLEPKMSNDLLMQGNLQSGMSLKKEQSSAFFNMGSNINNLEGNMLSLGRNRSSLFQKGFDHFNMNTNFNNMNGEDLLGNMNGKQKK